MAAAVASGARRLEAAAVVTAGTAVDPSSRAAVAELRAASLILADPAGEVVEVATP